MSWLALLRGFEWLLHYRETEMRRGLARVHKRPFAGVLLLQSQDNASGCFPRLTLNHARDSIYYWRGSRLIWALILS